MMQWTTTELDKVASVFNGKTPAKSEQRSEGHPVLKIRDVDEMGLFRGPFESFVDDDLAQKHGVKKVRAGDTLILNAAHNADYVASKTFRATPPSFGALATGEWLVVRPNDQLLDPGFANHWINSRQTRLRLRELVNGIHLYPKDVARLKISYPLLPEQRRIAAILDQAETLRTQRRSALALLDSLTQSLFLDMFGDDEKGEPRFAVAALADVLEMPLQNGAYYPKEEYVSEGGVEMVHMSDAFNGIVSRGSLKRVNCSDADLSKYGLNESDILLARRSLTYEGAAKPCLVPPAAEPLIFESSFIRVTPDKKKLSVPYLFHYLGNATIREKRVRPFVTQSTISGINQSNLERVAVVVPPLPLQQTFATRIASIEALKATHCHALAALDALFASLQQRAFTGAL